MKHWKAEHKATCKVLAVIPPQLPSYQDTNDCTTGGDNSLDLNGLDGDADLYNPYRYILIRPIDKQNITKKEWQDTVQGVDDNFIMTALDDLVLLQSGSDLDGVLQKQEGCASQTAQQVHAIGVLQNQLHWDKLGSALLPGYNARYDGFNLRGMYDNNYKTRPELQPNRNAGLLFMQPEGVCHGSVIVWCSEEHSEISAINSSTAVEDSDISSPSAIPTEGPTRSKADRIVPITRRNILQTIEYNLECSFARAVPERIHFENITRAAALRVFKKENFQMLDA